MSRLVLAPHADDESLGCGGLLAMHPDTWVFIGAKMDKVRLMEFKSAMEVFGVHGSSGANLPDGNIGRDARELQTVVDAMVQKAKPDELYIPSPSPHQDHTAMYEAGIRACRVSMHSGHWIPMRVYAYDVGAYDLQLFQTPLQWNVFRPLGSSEVLQKIQAVRCYESQSVDGGHVTTQIEGIAAAVGAPRGLLFAEQYALIREVL